MESTCDVCLRDFSAASLARCRAAAHAFCATCLRAHVRGACASAVVLAATRGGVPCAANSVAAPRLCGAEPWAAGELEAFLDVSTAIALQIATADAAFGALDRAAAAAAQTAAREAVARDEKASRAARVRELRVLVVENDLPLNPNPNCRADFFDFDGCLALRCSTRQCGACVCVLCLVDCGSNAHNHFYANHGAKIFDAPRFEDEL